MLGKEFTEISCSRERVGDSYRVAIHTMVYPIVLTSRSGRSRRYWRNGDKYTARGYLQVPARKERDNGGHNCHQEDCPVSCSLEK